MTAVIVADILPSVPLAVRPGAAVGVVVLVAYLLIPPSRGWATARSLVSVPLRAAAALATVPVWFEYRSTVHRRARGDVPSRALVAPSERFDRVAAWCEARAEGLRGGSSRQARLRVPALILAVPLALSFAAWRARDLGDGDVLARGFRSWADLECDAKTRTEDCAPPSSSELITAMAEPVIPVYAPETAFLLGGLSLVVGDALSGFDIVCVVIRAESGGSTVSFDPLTAELVVGSDSATDLGVEGSGRGLRSAAAVDPGQAVPFEACFADPHTEFFVRVHVSTNAATIGPFPAL